MIQLFLKNRIEYPVLLTTAAKVGAILSLINSDKRE